MTKNKIVFALKPVLAAMVFGACSTTPTMPPKAWSVDPVLEIQHAGRDADTYYQLGRYHDGQDRLGVAVAAYRVAVAANPQHGMAWNALGTALARTGRLAEAIGAFETAAAIASDASHIQNNLGYALMLAGRDKDAVVPLRRAIGLDRSNRHAWRNLETAYGRMGEREQAMVAKAFADAGQPPTTAPETQPVAATEDPPQTGSVLVQIAENVFELRAPAASHTEAVAEAATIITAAVAPVAGAPVAMAHPVPASGEAIRSSTLPPEPRIEAIAPTAAATSVPAPRRPQLVARIVRYEITNGQGGEGLARRLSALLGREGFERPRLTNHKPFDQMASYVEYREGYREAAAAFAKRLPFGTELRAASGNLVMTDVRLMLGKDLNVSDACSALGLCSNYARNAAPAKQAQTGGFTRASGKAREARRQTSDPI
ncbi:tetratricopeptide repeat protein [Aromatoleum toluvorans]|uniref:Tetratricopeptide repeat protein n=1 Tax=Aromatoleum toluvorans TaxID=92002 RepID=A0ABX1PWR7_9RHOO|nr:LytR C-terminal domain-containing protein [Aromatoleum toluvorans]NMG43080.1 tetratricopeptide repeat protein [Aromatoleum toluvorans]